MGVIRSQYVGGSLFPQRSPNGVWWMLYGRLCVLRMGRQLTIGFGNSLPHRRIFTIGRS